MSATKGLSGSLAFMVERALVTGQVQGMTLSGGLQIKVRKIQAPKGRMVWLQLCREKVRPSTKEWSTVRASMPAHVLVGDALPVDGENGRYYLRGKILLQDNQVQP